MATITKRISKDGTKTSYQVEIRRKGYPPIRKTFSKEKDARDFATLTEAKVLKNEATNLREATKWTIPQVIEWYRENPNPDRKLETKKHFNRLAFLEKEFAKFTVVSLTASILQKWIRKRLEINQPATVYHYYVALKNALVYHAIDKGYSQNIFNLVKCPSKSNRRERRFSEEETRILFKSIYNKSRVKRNEMRVTVLFALETGCRIGEMLKLTWNNVNLDSRTVTFVWQDTKTQRTRTIPLTSIATNILKWLRKHHYEKSTDRVFKFYHPNEHHLSRQFKIECSRAGLDNMVWHTLRHEATSRYFERTNLTDVEIASITGHQDLNMLKHYSHLRPSKLVDKLW